MRIAIEQRWACDVASLGIGCQGENTQNLVNDFKLFELGWKVMIDELQPI